MSRFVKDNPFSSPKFTISCESSPAMKFPASIIATTTTVMMALTASAWEMRCEKWSRGNLNFGKAQADVRLLLEKWNNAGMVPRGQVVKFIGKYVVFTCKSQVPSQTLANCHNSLDYLWNITSSNTETEPVTRVANSVPANCILDADSNYVTYSGKKYYALSKIQTENFTDILPSSQPTPPPQPTLENPRTIDRFYTNLYNA
ncbi:hypothetical protein BGX27_009302 [Mortierella sp. AM989]|nr:hypothetical protein BGX27_009302 [Mortierella sp. AM989]